MDIDGGGVRGLSSIMILQRIMNSFNRKRGDGQKLQPWQIFDLIGGTSTGGSFITHTGGDYMTKYPQNHSYNAWPTSNEHRRL